MTVSAIIPDPRSAKRTPEFIFVVKAEDRAEVRRSRDRDALEAERAYLLTEGAEES